MIDCYLHPCIAPVGERAYITATSRRGQLCLRESKRIDRPAKMWCVIQKYERGPDVITYFRQHRHAEAWYDVLKGFTQ